MNKTTAKKPQKESLFDRGLKIRKENRLLKLEEEKLKLEKEKINLQQKTEKTPAKKENYNTNIFTDFNIIENCIPEFIDFLKYLQKQDILKFDENNIYSSDFEIQYLKDSRTMFGISFHNLISEKYSKIELDNKWSIVSKYVIDKNGEHLKSKQMSNSFHSEEKELSIKKNHEILIEMHSDFLNEYE